MIPTYKFLLDNGNGLGQRVTHPIWKDDLSLEYAYESNQMFRRAQMSGSVTFVGADYDYIMTTAFDQEIAIEILVSYDNGAFWQIFFDGVFHMTDCTINVDDKSISVKPQQKDKYTKILAGLDKEYDLIKLAPAIQPVTMTRRPMIQIYVPGDSVVSCFLSSMQWEQDANETDDTGRLTDDFHFGKVGQFDEVTFTGAVPQYLTGTFLGSIPYAKMNGEWRCMENEYHRYFITYFHYTLQSQGGTIYYNGLRVYAEGNPSTVLWEFKQAMNSTSILGIPSDFTMTSQVSGQANLTAVHSATFIYARLCLATPTFNGNNTYAIPDDDIVPYNRNYKYCYPFGYDGLIETSYNHSETPTEWGIRPDGDYYAYPTSDLQTIRYMPVARSTWNYSSVWFRQTEATEQIEALGRYQYELRDAFTLEAVIKALLNTIDPTIQFEASQIYSRFLFGTNPLAQGWGRLVMTPKSNILVAEYSQPARKAPITLGQVLGMLRDVCGCYWYINDSKQLIIEHISWFKNGGSYSGTPAIGIDITIAENTRNGKMLSYDTNEYTYDKLDMPERYEFSWMDDTTDLFKGQAIDILSGYVQEGKIDETSVDGFNADVDYMMLNPSNVSEDGFALLCCTVTNGQYATTIASAIWQNNLAQNWQLTFVFLQPAFLISDMPAWSIKINGSQGTAKGIQRKKEQKVDIPVGYITPNMQTLVKTGLGIGEIKQMSIKMTSRMAKTTIMYDTTQQ